MWNPRTYNDADFGLNEGESFEPESNENDAAHADINKPHIMTLLGPIEPEELGICLPHVHLLCDPPGADVDHRLVDQDAAESEIEAFITMNGRSLVECSTRDTGRMATSLLEIAGWVPAHLIVATGRHAHKYASLMLGNLDVDGLANEFERELTEGILGSMARAGVIVVGATMGGITDVERATIQAASIAHQRTGAPVTIHTDDGNLGVEIVNILVANGVPSNRVIVGNIDREEMAFAAHVAIAKTGAYLQFDQIGTSDTYSDQQRAERVVELFRAGYAKQILLSLDYHRRSLMVSYDGQPGLPYLSEWFMVLLMEVGLEALEVRTLVVDNPARALTIHPPLV